MKINVTREIGVTVHLTVREAETLRQALHDGVAVGTLDKYLAGRLCDALWSANAIISNLPKEDIQNG